MLVERFVAWAASAPADVRAEAVGEFASMYLETGTSELDRAACERIFTLTLDDPDPIVRTALAQVLALSERAPQATVWALMQDIPGVATPVLQFSQQLCMRTLVDAIETEVSAVQEAIAKRQQMHGDVARALVAYGSAEALLALLENSAVVLGPVLKHDIARRHGNDPAIRAHLLREEDIKPETRQMLVLQLSKSLFDMVDDKAWVETKRIQDAANDSANRVTVDIAMTTDVEAMDGYVEHLRSTNQLTPALMLRAICAGNASFFECAIARLSGASLKRVQSIIDEGRLSAFKSLYKRTGLPQSAYGVFAAAIAVWHNIGASELENNASDALLCEKAILGIRERVQFDASVDSKLISLVQRLCAEAAKEAAHSGEEQLLLTAA